MAMHSNSEYLYHLYRSLRHTQATLHTAVFGGNSTPEPVALPRTILSILDRAKDREKLNPALTPASERAYVAAKSWAQWATTIYNDSLYPYVVIPGDGSLVIEWKSSGDIVTVRFDAEDDDTDLIISRIKGERQTLDFSSETLRTQLDRLLIENATPPPNFTARIAIECPLENQSAYTQTIKQTLATV